MPDLAVTRRFRPAAALLVAVAAAGVPACSSSQESTEWKEQNTYGSHMARKGFWREALFRYEKAAALHPDSAEIQNNLGVAYESVGETSRALVAYKRALELAPQDQKIKRNYARFAEYYTSVQRASSLPAPSSSSPAVRASPAPEKPGSAEPPLVPPSVGTVPSEASPGSPIPSPAQNPPPPPPAPTPGPPAPPSGPR
jgi:tetratricopeptide (TPR) repeat protein